MGSTLTLPRDAVRHSVHDLTRFYFLSMDAVYGLDPQSDMMRYVWNSVPWATNYTIRARERPISIKKINANNQITTYCIKLFVYQVYPETFFHVQGDETLAQLVQAELVTDDCQVVLTRIQEEQLQGLRTMVTSKLKQSPSPPPNHIEVPQEGGTKEEE